MLQYITAAEVRERLLGKVKFTNDDTDIHAMSSGLLIALCEEAEAEVELRLSVRYAVPFVTDDNQPFDNLPQHTKTLLKTLCRMEATRRILQTDFGRGSSIEGENFKEVEAAYESRLERLIQYRDGQFGHFKYPPLPSLKLNYQNDQSDDGFAGTILVTSDEYGNYAAPQMPSPGETAWRGKLITP